MKLLLVEPNVVFEWRNGVRLRARSRTQVLLPGGILRDGEEIGSLLEISNDEACISFKEVLRGI